MVTDPALKTTKSYFRMAFNTCFNLGFNAPSKDFCSLCIQLDEHLKQEKGPTKRNEIMTMKRAHKLKAKAFYSLLREIGEKTLVLSFGMQKNLTLPRGADRNAYYSHQLYFHTYSVVQGNFEYRLTKDNVFCYCWMENQYVKWSKKIASGFMIG
ncbi:hypothetical protein PR048_013375 [Dryococelus australis]|uniref:Uncharacterized protein n=1 Tax=Dryococelus australis TaxID=614101 RepID=A0ABQ9HRZ7_9NEOP|nr:hypothetical protein PR048_013375 [Dryococelus australis]